MRKKFISLNLEPILIFLCIYNSIRTINSFFIEIQEEIDSKLKICQMQFSPLNVQRSTIFFRLFSNTIIVDVYHLHHLTLFLIAKHPDLLISQEKTPFYLIRQVSFPRRLQLPRYGVNMPPLLPAPHIYVSKFVSSVDSNSIAAGAPDTLLTPF